MTPLFIILAALAVIFAWYFQRRKKIAEQRRALMHQPAPASWQSILDEHVAIYRRVPDSLREKLHGYMHVFLAEKQFEPCGALEEVSEDKRVAIAAQACLLLLNDRFGCFDRLESVLVYPTAFIPRRSRFDDDYDGEGDGQEPVHLGESWQTGSVILSWQSIEHGGSNEQDGTNVVLHEFAHQLDQIDSVADGAPPLAEGDDYREWAEVFGAAYERLVDQTEANRRTVMDKYGATNPAEFFAVATETFFEKARTLRRRYPDLYEQLKKFYAVDPAKW